MPEAVGTPIDIGLPLPLEVAGTLMALVGAAYPDCVIDTTGARGNGLHIVIPAGSRTRKVSKAEAKKTRALVEGEDGPSGNQFAGFSTSADGKVAATLLSEDEVIHSLAAGALAILERHEAENYVEWTLTADGRSLAVSACWSESQTPHQLRLAAEVRADAAEARVAELEQALQQAKDRALMTPSEREGLLGETAETSNQPEASLARRQLDWLISDLQDAASLRWTAEWAQARDEDPQLLFDYTTALVASLKAHGRALPDSCVREDVAQAIAHHAELVDAATRLARLQDAVAAIRPEVIRSLTYLAASEYCCSPSNLGQQDGVALLTALGLPVPKDQDKAIALVGAPDA